MKTLVWDVDDVLNDLMRAWFEKSWLPAHPNCSLRYEQLQANPPDSLLGVKVHQYLASMDLFRQSVDGMKLTPDAEVVAWFSAHGHHFRHMALTARPLESAPAVAAWVMKYFGSWIRVFGVVPSRPPLSAPVYDANKGEYLRWLGKGDVLIDDSPENLAQASALGLQTIAWPQPWNQARASKTEILNQLLDMAEEK